MEFPHFKLVEYDDKPFEPVNPEDIKVAQSMEGALLWLTTRTRPDLSMGVAAVSRLATRNPKKSIDSATVLMQYIKGSPGIGLHYTKNVLDDWGAHGQLNVKRSELLLEVFCDIACSAGTGHRSIQGIVVCLGGQHLLANNSATVCHSLHW